MLAMKLTHFDESGKARMVDVTVKADTDRTAVAEGRIVMKAETLSLYNKARWGKAMS